MRGPVAAAVTRPMRRVTTAILLVLTALVVAAAPASAHAVLLSMSPADGSLVMSAPTAVVLTFDAPIQSVGDAVVVTGPTGESVTNGSPVIVDATVTQRLVALTTPGRYHVGYRVVSADGHPVERELTFYYQERVDPAPTSTPDPATSAWIPVGLASVAIVGVAVTVAIAWAVRRSRRTSHHHRST